MVLVPAFGDIGKSSKEVLYGAKDGVYQYDQKGTITAKTSDGVTFTGTALRMEDKLDITWKAAYSTKKYSYDALWTASKVTVSGSVLDLAPGLKVNASVALPDPSTGKLGLDYSFPYLNLKTSVGLTSAPNVEAAVASGYNNLLVGAEVAYSTQKSAVSKWGLAAGYHAPDFQVAAFLSDKGDTLKVVGAHNISSSKSIAAEIVKKVSGGDAAFVLGYTRVLDNGALTKFKLDSQGALSALYQTKLVSGEKIALSAQVDTLNLTKAPKIGFSVDLL